MQATTYMPLDRCPAARRRIRAILPGRRRARALLPKTAIALVPILLVTACGGSIAGTPRAEPTTSVAPALEPFYTQQPAWGDCAGLNLDVPVSTDVECAMVEVPLDYAQPDGEVATIATARRPATGDRIGALLTNPGGPGMAGTWLADMPVPEEISERFDIVGFDPRGIGASRPLVRCRTDEEIDVDRADVDIDMSPAGIAETEQENREFIARCEERVGSEVLARVGTEDVARDLDVLRAVLGDRRLTYLGYSYGTRLGTTYARLFPQNVRALVLDGAVIDLEADNATDAANEAAQDVVEQQAAFQRSFDEFALDCSLRPSCPLGADPTAAVARFRALVDPLIDRPIPAADGRVLGYSDAMLGTYQALYDSAAWRDLFDGLDGVRDGRGDRLLELADQYLMRGPDGTYTNMDDAFTAVRCIDEPAITDPAVAADFDARLREAAPFAAAGAATGAAPMDLCAMWPVPPAEPPTGDPPADLPPTLVVSTTGDPATPYEDGVALAESLGAGLISYEGEQHTVVFSGVDCVDSVVAGYLLAPENVGAVDC